MKICIAGVDRVDKKALMFSLYEYLKLPLVFSPESEILEGLGYASNEELRLRGIEGEFQSRVVDTVAHNHAIMSEMISDHSVFDWWAADRIKSFSAIDYASLFSKNKLRYDLVIVVSKDFTSDSKVQLDHDIQDEIIRVVEDSSMPFMVVSGDVFQQTEAVLGSLMALFDGMKSRIMHNEKENNLVRKVG